tara:strand:+ start:2003 stop:2656 length:654 start_codon:yes stop_codon:yes gene_type:complete
MSIQDYQNYNYAKHIKSPKDLDVSNDGNIFVSIRDTNAIFPYIDTLIYGKNVISDSSVWDLYPLGSNYFIKSGTCGDTSSEECKGQDRYIYVRNVPSGVIPCMGSFTPKTNMKGLVPGLMEDVADVNPFALFNNLMGKGSAVNDRCIKQTLPVGKTTLSAQKGVSKETRCSPEIKSPSCLPELFTDYNSKKIKKNNNVGFIFVFIILIIMILIYKNK